MCFSANIQYFLKYIFPAVSTSGDCLGFNCLCFEIFVFWTILIGIIHLSVTAQSVIDPPIHQTILCQCQCFIVCSLVPAYIKTGF